MSVRGKDFRCEIDTDLHEQLRVLAEFERKDIAALGSSLLEKMIVGEWLPYSRAIAQINFVPQPEKIAFLSDRRAGFVYVIRLGRRYKIGKATDWRKRLSNAMFPEPPEIICVIETDDRHRLERELHKKYAVVRVHGEWFELLKSHIDELLHSPNVVSVA
ncbi:MAG: GIY-YIG nuclease family protein [Sulfuricaulis sp.]